MSPFVDHKKEPVYNFLHHSVLIKSLKMTFNLLKTFSEIKINTNIKLYAFHLVNVI